MKIILFSFSLLLLTMNLHSQTKVIAHRGYWQTEGSAQNSLTALKLAQELGVYASEFDVWITADDMLVIYHDATIDEILIEKANFSDLKNLRLSNGEPLPTLEEFLLQGKKNSQVKLILELKPHKSKEREKIAIQKILELVKKHGIEEQMEYISFRLNSCKEFKRLSPQSPISYLKGTKSPKKIKKLGLDGIDYHYKILNFKKNWTRKAKELGLTVNVWTVNNEKCMQKMIDKDVDYITTDRPIDCQNLIEKAKKTVK